MSRLIHSFGKARYFLLLENISTCLNFENFTVVEIQEVIKCSFFNEQGRGPKQFPYTLWVYINLNQSTNSCRICFDRLNSCNRFTSLEESIKSLLGKGLKHKFLELTLDIREILYAILKCCDTDKMKRTTLTRIYSWEK